MREKTNRAYSRSVHRRWSFDFTYYFFTENKKPLRYTVYGTRAIQDAVVSASEIIMWCDVSQVSEKCYVSFFFFFLQQFFFPLSKTVPACVRLPLTFLCGQPRERYVNTTSQRLRGGCVSLAVKNLYVAPFLEFGVRYAKGLYPRFAATFLSHRTRAVYFNRALVQVVQCVIFLSRRRIPRIYDSLHATLTTEENVSSRSDERNLQLKVNFS